MRVWDIPVTYLCDKHLLAQHVEIHTIYNVISQDKKGYSKHPETLRWVDRLPELKLMHSFTVYEMKRRNYNHKSPIDDQLSEDLSSMRFGAVDPIWRQIHNIYRKGCKCNLEDMYTWYDLIGKNCESEAQVEGSIEDLRFLIEEN